MNNGYDDAILQLLGYGVDLNIEICCRGKYRTPFQIATAWNKIPTSGGIPHTKLKTSRSRGIHSSPD
jgi:hypothetical protein